MAKAKRISIGRLLKQEKDWHNDGNKVSTLSIALGSSNNKNPAYDMTVELTVRDGKGNVLAQQKNGFLELVDPRKQPDELLKAGVIQESVAEEMRERAAKLSPKVKYEVRLKTS